MRIAATPSGKPIASAGPTEPATSAMWRPNAAAKRARGASAYSRAIDKRVEDAGDGERRGPAGERDDR